MNAKILTTVLLILGAAGTLDAQITIPDNKHVNVGVVYPVSSNGRQAGSIVNCFSLNLIAGISAGETGLCIAGFLNYIGQYSSGVEIAGFANIDRGDANTHLPFRRPPPLWHRGPRL